MRKVFRKDLVGKTILEIENRAANVLTMTFTDGSKCELWAELGSYQIPFILTNKKKSIIKCTKDTLNNKYWKNCDGKLHRLKGPAVELTDGEKFWYFKGKRIYCSSQKDFEKQIERLKITPST